MMNSFSFSVRRYEAGDENDVFELHLDLFPVRYTKELIHSVINTDTAISFVAEVEQEDGNKKIVGFILVDFLESSDWVDVCFSENKKPCLLIDLDFFVYFYNFTAFS